MLKVLINSYACCPAMGSEQGMGWNWITNIAEECDCYIITESEYQEFINSWMKTSGNERIKNHLHFFFIEIGDSTKESERIRKMCWKQGTWSFYFYYAKWQKKALNKAIEIIEEKEKIGDRIDILHQLNMAGFREPGMLYKINEGRARGGKSRIPLVWGPMTGYGSIPFSFMISGGLKLTSFYLVKNALNWLQLICHYRVRKMIKASDTLIAATPEMKKGIEQYYHRNVEHINETGVHINSLNAITHKRFDLSANDTLKVLWVGRFMYTKQLELALKTMQKLKTYNIELHIVGRGASDDETEKYHSMAKDLGLATKNIIWHGQIENNEVLEMMQECDVFFFTSIFEATSTVILEAIQSGLPIVCFNRSGFGPIVDEKIGIKIPCKSPQKAIDDFSNAILHFYNNRESLLTLSRGCQEKQNELSWEKKMERLMAVYNELSGVKC